VNPISVFACEAQPIVIEGLQTVLSKCEDVTFAGAVRSIGDAFDAVNRIKPDVVLIDLSSGLTSSLRLVSSLKATSQSSHGVLWVVDLPEMETFRALQMGVRGIVRKSLPIPNLLDCLRMVGNGKVWMDDSEEVSAFFQRKEASRLTPREKQVVALICRGMKNKQIAENLHITPGTVKVHLMHIFEKTGLKDRLALAVHGRELVSIEQFRDNAIA
jgi:DNA-binding NarL/FixJ family response regulator